MRPGRCKVKDSLTKTNCLMCSPEDITGKELEVVDTAVDDSGYLCVTPSKNAMVDVHADDVEWFKPSSNDIIDILAGIVTFMASKRRK